MPSPNFPNLPIRITKLSDIWMVRDDLLPFGFGTKWRKVSGIVESLQKNQIKKVLLWGALHGNYLASFTTILRYFGFQVETISYSKDPKLKTYNERLVNLHSHTIHCYANRKEAEQSFSERTKTFEGLCLQEFGIHPAQSNGLRPFWQQLEKEIHEILNGIKIESKGDERFYHTNKNHANMATLVLEIGSGASFLSAYDYFRDSSIFVLGVMVGEKKATWIPKIESLQKKLGLKIQTISQEMILNFTEKTSPNEIISGISNSQRSPFTNYTTRFAKTRSKDIQSIQKFYTSTNIILEPIYSAKSLLQFFEIQNITGTFPSEPKLNNKNENLPNFNQNLPLFYLHQGGHVQHLDMILEVFFK
ncbi:1-aminocyclopropane-1-carboxylate deaminase [Leptospira bouyouniensis]|uniref:1-aminocyclopropane-1-carboxylate deaminase n=2 Tax=Leptospira bouyouniensis TaxID=2484911 RepID=A0A7I0HPX6_9LEPT|nr:1-aminocyclopropane-1-carboxylate deaminase [Leptospira bouyouniensis]